MTRTYALVIDSDDPDVFGEAKDIQDILEQEQVEVISVTPTPTAPTLQSPPTQQTFPTQ